MSLSDWVHNGWVTPQPVSDVEIADLLRIADRDLKDCGVKGVSADWRFNIAYNAALQASRAALFGAGFRASRESHHHRVIQSLSLTLKLPANEIKKFDMFRTKRNFSDYEAVGAVSENDVMEMVRLARTVRESTGDWLKKNRSGVFPL